MNLSVLFCFVLFGAFCFVLSAVSVASDCFQSGNNGGKGRQEHTGGQRPVPLTHVNSRLLAKVCVGGITIGLSGSLVFTMASWLACFTVWGPNSSTQLFLLWMSSSLLVLRW